MDRVKPERLQEVPPPKAPQDTHVDCWQDASAARLDPAALDVLTQALPALSAHDRLLRLASAIEADIIPLLLRRHGPESRPAEPEAPPVLGAADVQYLAGLAMGSSDEPMDAVLDAWAAQGVGLEPLLLDLIAPAARHLGEMWEQDRCDFVDVSIGLGRLQQAVRRLSAPQGQLVTRRPDGRRVVLMPAPGEQHTLGVSIVAEFFLRAGWDVTTALNADISDPVEQVRSEWFDVIGISVATTARLDWLRNGIQAMRKASLNKSVGVMVGGPIFIRHPEYASQLGADGFAADGRQATVEAENLLAQRVKRT